MAGYIERKNSDGWDAENETWAEYKKRKSSKSAGMGQKKINKRENLSEVRERALKRANYSCEWPECNSNKWLELAHLTAIGMGGKNNDIAADMNNVSILCKHHHDVFDGRQRVGLKLAYTELLRGYLMLRWNKKNG
jgi:hypothetical protein